MRKITSILATVLLLIAQPVLADSPPPDIPLNPDLQDVMVGVAISGGGLRSAAFAYGVISMLNEERICRSVTDEKIWIVVPEKDVKAQCKEGAALNLLDQVRVISGVSGGALPAAFLHWYGKDVFLEDFERTGLKAPGELRNTLKNGFRETVKIEAGDFVVDLLPFVPGSVRAARALAERFDSKGLVNIETVSKFFKDKGLFKPDKKLKHPKDKLLIHTTDLTNSGIFTFYGHDSDCLSGTFAIEDMLAASAAMPGLVEPLVVSADRAMKLGPDCSRRYGNAVRNTGPPGGMFLNDGGVYDNLAIDGLLRYLIENKRLSKEKQRESSGVEEYLRPKTLLLAINGAPPAAYAMLNPQAEMPGIVNLVLRAFDLLASQKDATTRFLFEEARRYGTHVVELNFSGLLPDNGHDDRAIQMLRTLGAISWFPNEQEVQTLISAGRQVVARRTGQIGQALSALSDKVFVGDCSGLSEEDKEYCWPERWTDRNPYDDGLDGVLQEVRRDRDDLRKRQSKFLHEGRSGAQATLIDAMAQSDANDEVYAVDYGLVDWKDGFSAYQDANVEAVKQRKVSIARTFIIHEELLKSSTRKRLDHLVDVIVAQAEAGIDVRIALKKSLKNDPRSVARYHRGHRNGMVLFKYGKKEPRYKVLMEEATEYSGEPGHPGLYYALQTHAVVDSYGASGVETGGSTGYDPIQRQRQHVEDRAVFLAWINGKDPLDVPPKDLVCRLEPGQREKQEIKKEILQALQQGKLPCAPPATQTVSAPLLGAR